MQRCQGGNLHRRWLRWWLLFQTARRHRLQLRLPTGFVTLDPGIGQRNRFRVQKNALELPPGFEEACVAGIVDPIIPFQAVL